MPQGDFQITVPAPRRTPVRRSVDDLNFEVKAIEVSGVTAYGAEVIHARTRPWIGRRAVLADILALAEEIEAMYREDGYVLSRAIVPPQKVSDGIFRINVIEGYIAAVRVEGGSAATQERIERALRPVIATRPLNARLMERALLLANDLPGLQAAGLLRPSVDEPGASDLVVSLTQTPLSGGLSVDNRGSRFVGPWTTNLDAAINSLFDQGETITIGLGTAADVEEKRSLQLRYAQPVGAQGLNLSFGGVYNKGAPGLTLRRLDVKTESLAFGPRATYPVIRSRAFNLILDAGVTFQQSETMVQNEQFSRDVWRVADLGMTLSEVGFLAGTSSLTLGAAQGLDAFGAAEAGSTPLSRRYGRPDFTKFTGLLRRLQPLPENFSLSLTTQGQWSLSPLLAGEQFAVGGRIGRGYDAGALTGDHGIGQSSEIRYDQRFEGVIKGIQPYAFYDIGATWNRYPPGRQTDMISSTGAGMRLALDYAVNASLEFAQTLTQLPANTNDNHLRRIYFELSHRF